MKIISAILQRLIEYIRGEIWWIGFQRECDRLEEEYLEWERENVP